MHRQIKRWTDDAVIWEGDAETVKDALHAAIAAKADLRCAVLTDADLTRADLTGADLTGADLTRAVLTGADLTSIRDDVWAVLSSAPAEAPAVLEALRAGRVNGSTYHGACACLVGTIANTRHCSINDLGPLRPNSSRPAETFFMSIREGDTPETSQHAKLAAEWVNDWLIRVRAAFGPTPTESASVAQVHEEGDRY